MLATNFDLVRLRWRFDFLNRPPRYGQWSRAADRLEDMAAFQNADGLKLASIEAQDVVTNKVFTVADCRGEDYCNFQWIYAAWGFDGGHVKIVGLTLVSRDMRCSVYVDGQTSLEPRTEADKKYHYATYGR